MGMAMADEHARSRRTARRFVMALGGALLLHTFVADALEEVDGARVEKPRGTGAGSEEKLLADFVMWLNSNGVDSIGTSSSLLRAVVDNRTFEPLQATNARADISIVATKEIKAGDQLLSIPSKLLVSSKKLVAEGFTPYEQADSTSWQHYTTMAAWLLLEKAKGQDSFFAPYISILPAYVPLPTFYESDLLKEFEYDKLISEAQSTAAYFEAEYERSAKEKIANASLEEFKWAMSILWSRCFSANGLNDVGEMESSEAGLTDWHVVLIPLGDMLNHHDYYQANWSCATDGSTCSFTSLFDVAEGMPVYTSYGQKTSDELALSYGFVSPEVVHDRAVLFQSTDDLVAYYISKRPQMQYEDTHRQWAEYIAERTKQEVDELLKAGKGNSANTFAADHQGVSGFTIQNGAKVDPRLVAAIASIFAFEAKNAEPPYETLAALSITFSEDFSRQDCEGVLKEPQDDLHGMQMVVHILHQRVVEMIHNFSTTYEDDKMELERLRDCKHDFMKGGCKEVWKTHDREWEIILRLRMAKKYLLYNAEAQLARSCWATISDLIGHEGQSDEGLGHADLETSQDNSGDAARNPEDEAWTEL